MLRNKFERHTISFLTITLASLLLYPSGRAGVILITWVLLGLIVLAAVLTLMTK